MYKTGLMTTPNFANRIVKVYAEDGSGYPSNSMMLRTAYGVQQI